MINLIVIPAKGMSKRLSNKNLLELGNYRTLVEFAVERADDSDLGNVIVSTDSQRIKNIINDEFDYRFNSDKTRKILVYERSKELCAATIRAWQVCLDVVDKYEAFNEIKIDNIIMTLPTSPFANHYNLIEAYDMFIKNDGKPVMSVTRKQGNPNLFLEYGDLSEENRTLYANELLPNWKLRASCGVDNYLQSNGAVWICPVDLLREKREQYIDGMLGYEMDEKEGFDINTPFDYEVACALYDKDNK